MTTSPYAAVVMIAALLTGCTLRYDVDMVPDGDSIDRTVTVSADVPELQQKALKDAIGTPNGTGEHAHDSLLSYSSSVSGAHWSDGFGGQGSWAITSSPLGSVTTYCNALGGAVPTFDDLTHIADGIEAVEEVIRKRILEQLGDDPEVRQFLKIARRRALPDAIDAAMMGWAVMFTSSLMPEFSDDDAKHAKEVFETGVQSKLASALAAFLWQRQWITADEAAVVTEDPGMFEELSARITARALGWKETDGWNERLTDLFDRMGETFESEDEQDKFDETVMTTFADAVGDRPHLIIAFRTITAILTSHEVAFRLHAQSKPDITNGTWVDHGGGRWVEWTYETAPMAIGLLAMPTTQTASWTHPDDDFQSQLLGSQRISGKDLVTFCAAWNGSTSAQQATVEKTLDSIRSARSGTNANVSKHDVLRECMEIMLEDKAPRHERGG